jgi:hypothetical protein
MPTPAGCERTWTPTFFVNGIRHDGGYDPEALLDALRREH